MSKLQPITIDIQICTGCKSHQWCTRHDEKKYESTFQQVSHAIRSRDASITVNKHLVAGNKIGAFEISSDGKLLYSKLECGYFPHIKYIADRVCDFVNDKREGKNVEGYDIQSVQSKMRKSNQKYYDKLTKSSVVERSPRRPEGLKGEKKEQVQGQVEERKKEEKKVEQREAPKEQKKREEKKQEKKQEKKEDKKRQERKSEKKQTEKKQEKREEKKQEKKQQKVSPKKEQKKEQKKESVQSPIKQIQPVEAQKSPEKKQQIPQQPSTHTNPQSPSKVQQTIHQQHPAPQQLPEQLPQKHWTSNISNSQFQLIPT